MVDLVIKLWFNSNKSKRNGMKKMERDALGLASTPLVKTDVISLVRLYR